MTALLCGPEIRIGDFGWTLELLVRDARDCCGDGGEPADISDATTKNLLITSPAGVVTTKTASFVTDGTDGLLKYLIMPSDVSTIFNAAGNWKVQARVIKTGVYQYTTTTHVIPVVAA